MKLKLMCKKVTSWVLVVTLILGISMIAYATEGEEYVNEEVARIVEEALKNPGTVSFDDVAYAMQQDEKAARVILDYFSEVAVPIDDETALNSNQTEDDVGDIDAHIETNMNCLGSYEYNPKTGEETYKLEEFDMDEGDIRQTEPVFPDDPVGMIRSSSTILYPEDNKQLKTIYKLFIHGQTDGLFYGSAFALSGKYLATAGHCVYNKKVMDGWAGSILCVPAYRVTNGTEVRPLGSSYQVANNMACGEDWKKYADYNYDWGVLQLQKEIPTGAMGKREVGYSTNIIGRKVYFAGYPGGQTNMQKMYTSVSDYTMYTATVDEMSYEGQSGGPVWDTDGYIIGIISRGSTSQTIFVKFNPVLYQKMISYK